MARYLGNGKKGIPGSIEMATAAGLKPAAEKLRSKQCEDEYEHEEYTQERHHGSNGVEQTAHQIAQKRLNTRCQRGSRKKNKRVKPCNNEKKSNYACNMP